MTVFGSLAVPLPPQALSRGRPAPSTAAPPTPRSSVRRARPGEERPDGESRMNGSWGRAVVIGIQTAWHTIDQKQTRPNGVAHEIRSARRTSRGMHPLFMTPTKTDELEKSLSLSASCRIPAGRPDGCAPMARMCLHRTSSTTARELCEARAGRQAGLGRDNGLGSKPGWAASPLRYVRAQTIRQPRPEAVRGPTDQADARRAPRHSPVATLNVPAQLRAAGRRSIDELLQSNDHLGDQQALLDATHAAVPEPCPEGFRQDAVRVARIRGPGVTVEQVATDFRVHPMTLWKWMRRADR
ncbi:hypothetical protein RKD23_007758 [Streptomyces sp. SAI-170]